MEYLEAFFLVVGGVIGVIFASIFVLFLLFIIIDVFLAIIHSDNFMDF